jgi:hypothetical protein
VFTYCLKVTQRRDNSDRPILLGPGHRAMRERQRLRHHRSLASARRRPRHPGPPRPPGTDPLPPRRMTGPHTRLPTRARRTLAHPTRRARTPGRAPRANRDNHCCRDHLTAARTHVTGGRRAQSPVPSCSLQGRLAAEQLRIARRTLIRQATPDNCTVSGVA